MVASDPPAGRWTPDAGARPGAAPTLLLVDGDNLLHRVRGTRDDAGLDWLLRRLAAWRPASTRVVVVLDGHPPPDGRMAGHPVPGIEVRHSGPRTADATLIIILADRPAVDRASTVVVSDDSAVRREARQAGGLARPVAWLVDRLAAGLAGTRGPRGPLRGGPVGIGRGGVARDLRRADGPAGDGSGNEARSVERMGWAPGRGATRKRGNPRRSSRARGSGTD